MYPIRSAFYTSLLIGFFLGVTISAQESTAPGPVPSGSASTVLARGVSGPYKTIERSDWSRYENGKYLGHVYREVRATIAPLASRGPGGTIQYRGDFLVLEETLRDLSQSARAVDTVVPATFFVATDGRIDLKEDRGFPSLRGFPAFPAEPVAVGAHWTAKGVRAADPRNDGSTTLVPLIAEYEYRGIEQYKGQAVHRIFAKYATRHKATAKASASFTAASGTHEVDILIRVEDGLPLLLRDRLDETFTWADGSTTRFKGFTLTFSEGTTLIDRGALAADLRDTFAGMPAEKGAEKETSKSSVTKSAPPTAAEPQRKTKNDGAGGTVRAGPDSLTDGGGFDLAPAAAGIDVETVEAGVKLTVRDIRFLADSDEILAAERDRLDLIAEALKQAGERTILVEGHTAAIGKSGGELDLSIRRAKRIVEELSARGIGEARFLYKGWGGTKPIAGNDTEAGRSRNRRVEITILE
jgi:outer membrane protein OmpA-like peptidoglycan-associated protein